jgi:Fur family ferric uptake transcriptional regulator
MSRQRRTRQQIVIEHIFDHTVRPLSPKEVIELAQTEIPNIGMATVYRALNHMVSEGILRVVDLPGQTSRYEHANLHHHHHFHCTECDKVFDLQGCLLRKEMDLPDGFDVKHHDITLTGTCPDCGA